MINLPAESIREPVAQARRFAALSGSFDPRSLRDVVGDMPTKVALAVTADLADDCDTGSESGKWLMRGSVRRREIDSWAAEGTLDEAIEWRRALPHDEATEDLLAALRGSGGYAETEVHATIDADAGRDTLNRIAVALERAGERAPAHSALEAVRSALGRLDARDRAEAMLSRGFYGRVRETEKIADWLERPITIRPVKALYISGLPGIGKSTLVDEAARRASLTTRPWIVVRLDFDRGGLDVQDQVGLTMEIGRQISISLGDAAATLQQARLVAASAALSPNPDVTGEGRKHIPDKLSGTLGDAVRRASRPILIILDTLEVLRGRGETHPGRLFAFLDELCDRGLMPLAVIAAGRGDALDSAPDRIGYRIVLGGLDPVDADAMLRELDVAEAAFGEIRELADGNPLVLRLAALAVREAGPEALTRARGRREVAAAYLYRFLLSRIMDPTLRRLAQPGLVVRRINPEVIAEVLAPQLKLGRLEPGQAVALFDALATHHWLVEPDPTPGWVRHRPDIRAVLLRLLYGGGSAATAARIDRAAAKWFARRSESFAPVEAAYHQLQAMRRGGEPPEIDPQVLGRFDKDTIAELPRSAQDLILSARGERTSQFRTGTDASAASSAGITAAAKELEAILERGDVIEAAFIYDRAFAQRDLDPRSPEADIARTFLWRAGRWRAATKDLGRQRSLERLDEPSFYDRSPLGSLAQLEIWAEMWFAQLVGTFERNPSLAAFADELRTRHIKGALGSGALGFALLRAGVTKSRLLSNFYDPVDGAEIVWNDDSVWTVSPIDPRVLDALAMPASRFAPRVSPPAEAIQERLPSLRMPDRSTPAGAARLLAASTPYASVAEALRSLDGGRVGSHLLSVDFNIAEAGGLPPSGKDAPSGRDDWVVAPAVSPEGSIESIAALGLLAESLGAAAFVLRHADLRLLAQSAERWRRTTAGDWAYTTPARRSELPWSRDLDATTADRIGQLLLLGDPIAGSEDQLRLWWGGERKDAPNIAGRLARRFPAAIREAQAAARRHEPPEAARRAAIALQGRNLPSAFVPPLAVLISFRQLEEKTT